MGDARDLVSKLLEKNPSKRLGNKNDAEDLKKHPFFAGIDWDALYNKRLEAPLIPPVSGLDDVAHFSRDFTDTVAVDTPVPAPKAKNAEKLFRNYSYVAPQWRQARPQEVSPIERRDQINRPRIEEVLKAKDVSQQALVSPNV